MEDIRIPPWTGLVLLSCFARAASGCAAPGESLSQNIAGAGGAVSGGGSAGQPAHDAGGEPTAAPSKTCGPESGGPEGAPWSGARNCPTHAGRSNLSGPTSGTVRWQMLGTAPLGQWEVFRPLAVGADGTVYASSIEDGALSARLYAIAPNGKVKWKVEDALGTPALGADGTVFIGYHIDGNDRGLRAIRPDGTSGWIFERPGYDVEGANPIVASDETIYFALGDTLYAVRPDGSEAWQFRPESAEDVLVVDVALAHDGSLYVLWDSETQYYLTCLAPTGSTRWQAEVMEYSANVAIADNGSIYCTSSDGLAAYDAEGAKRWFVPGEFGRPTLAADGTVYAGAYELSAFAPSGALLWTVAGPGFHTLVDGDGTIYATLNSQVAAFAPDGSVRWQTTVEFGGLEDLVLGLDQILYAASMNSYVSAIGAPDAP